MKKTIFDRCFYAVAICSTTALRHHARAHGERGVNVRLRVRGAAVTGTKPKNQAESLFFFFFRSNPVAVQVDSRLH
jgi:hypothetical protein